MLIDVQPEPRDDPRPLVTKASRAYQVLLLATRNMKEECPKCSSKFCPEGYLGTGKDKIRSAKEHYLKNRSGLLGCYEGGGLPEELSNQIPEIKECWTPQLPAKSHI